MRKSKEGNYKHNSKLWSNFRYLFYLSKSMYNNSLEVCEVPQNSCSTCELGLTVKITKVKKKFVSVRIPDLESSSGHRSVKNIICRSDKCLEIHYCSCSSNHVNTCPYSRHK
jgi:hypothetical protein